MPEGYTHLRIAAKAAAAMRHKLKWPAAFAAGANGPDIFFCFEAWRGAKKRRYDLPALGVRMHEEDTGAFLCELVRCTRTGPQAEYTLGFLSHYAADTVLHPYVATVSAPGMPYAQKGGHGYFEIALDSTLHREDTGDAVVPAAEACPTPAGEALAEITALLRTALRRVYGLEIPAEYIADSFFYSTRLRGIFTSRFGVRRAVFWLLEPLFGGRGRITVHVSPRKLKGGLPDTWIDPATGEEKTGDVFALMAQAQERSRQYMAAAVEVWSGRQPLDTLAALLGSASYTTGTPTARSDPGSVPPEPPPPTEEPPEPPPAERPAEEKPAEELSEEAPAPPAEAPAPEPPPQGLPAAPEGPAPQTTETTETTETEKGE